MYVKRLKTNLKYVREVELGPCTIITGANTAGKTALVESLSLATTGESARFGKDGKKALAATVGDEGKPRKAHIVAQFDNGEEANWTCEGTPDKASRPKADGKTKATSLTRGNGLDAIREGGSKLQAWLIEVAERESLMRLTHADLLQRLEPSLHDIWLSIWTAESADSNAEPKQIGDVTSRLYNAKKDTRAQLKQIETLQKEGINPLSPAQQDKLAELENRLAESQAGPVENPHEVLQQILEQLEDMRLAPVRLTVEMQQLFSHFATFMTRINASEMKCPCCKQTQLSHSALRARVEELGQTLSKSADKYANVKELLHREYGARQAMINHVQNRPLDRKELERLNELRQLRAKYEQLTSLVSQEGALSSKVDNITKLEKLVAYVADTYAKEGATVLKKLSARVLPKGAHVEARKQGRGYMLGLARRGMWRSFPTLSGAEGAMLLGAVEASICSNTNNPARILVIDDVWFDRATLLAFLKGLQPHVGEDASLTQVIVCCVEWRGKPPKGWERLDLDAMLKAEEAAEEEADAQALGEGDNSQAEAEVIVSRDELVKPIVLDGFNGGLKTVPVEL